MSKVTVTIDAPVIERQVTLVMPLSEARGVLSVLGHTTGNDGWETFNALYDFLKEVDNA